MNMLHVLPASLLAIATPFAIALPAARTASQSQRLPMGKTEGEHVGQIPHLYDMRDMLRDFGGDYPLTKMGVIETWRAPESTEARMAASSKTQPSPTEVEEQIDLGGRTFVDVLKRHMQPTFLEPTERLEYASGTILAHLMPSQHDWVNAFVRRVRDFDGLIETETRIIEADPAVFVALGLEDKSILSRPADLAILDERIRATGKCNLLAAPRVMTRPARQVNVSVIEPFKFVQDWSIEKVEPGPREIAIPKIAMIREGVELTVRALPLENDQFAIELSVQSARVKRPVRTVPITVGSDAKQLVITLPEAHSERFEGTLLLTSGASTILRGMSVDRSKSIAVIVTARKVPREPR